MILTVSKLNSTSPIRFGWTADNISSICSYSFNFDFNPVQCIPFLVWGWHSNPDFQWYNFMGWYILRIDEWAQYFQLPSSYINGFGRLPRLKMSSKDMNFRFCFHYLNVFSTFVCEAIWVGRHRSKKTLIKTCHWMPAHRKDSAIRPKPSTNDRRCIYIPLWPHSLYQQLESSIVEGLWKDDDICGR